MAEKCKPCRIDRRMCGVYGETFFSQHNVSWGANHKFACMSLSWKDSLWSENTDFLVKKRFWAQLWIKKIVRILFWDMKGPITIDFQEKGASVNSTSYYQLLWQNSPYLLNDTCILYNCFKYPKIRKAICQSCQIHLIYKYPKKIESDWCQDSKILCSWFGSRIFILVILS